MLKGKRAILNSLGNNPNLVRRMRELNNCKAAGTGCRICRLPRLFACWSKVQKELQTEAFRKYADNPKFRKERDRVLSELNKEEKGE